MSLDKAERIQVTLCAELHSSADALRANMKSGKLVTPKEVKAWRRGWVDRAMEIRNLARATPDNHARTLIREHARRIEDLAKEVEEELLPDAQWLADAEGRGGILNPVERAQRASEQRKVSRAYFCSRCGGPVSRSEARICDYCGGSIDHRAARTSRSGAVELLGLDGSIEIDWPADAGKRLEFHRDILLSMKQSFEEAVEAERSGLLMVLHAGQKITEEFFHAYDDAGDRLHRHWQHLRAFGRKQRYLDSDEMERLLTQLSSLQANVMSAVQSKARLEWDRSQKAGVTCVNCGSFTEPEFGFSGEMPCIHCGVLLTVEGHLTQFQIDVNRKMDDLVVTRRATKEDLEQWKRACISDPRPEKIERLRLVATDLYDQQFFYIKDDEKRAIQVERVVKRLLAEVGE